MSNKVHFEHYLELIDLPIVKINIGDSFIYAMVDSGANINYLCDKFAKFVKGDFIKTKDSNVDIICAGSDVSASFSAEVDFSLGDKNFSESFTCVDLDPLQRATYGLPSPAMMILGSGFLSKHKCILDYKKNTLVL